MENWTPAPDRPGYRRKVIQRGAATIIIDRPMLDEAQTAKAEQMARIAMESAMREHIRRATA